MMTADEFEKMDTVLDRSKIGCPRATLALWVIAGIVALGCACLVGWALVSTVLEKPPPPPSAANTAQLHMYQEKVKLDIEKEKLIIAEVKEDIAMTKGDVKDTETDQKSGDAAEITEDKANLSQDASELKKDKQNLLEIAKEVAEDKAKEQAAIDELKAKDDATAAVSTGVSGGKVRRRRLRGAAIAA